MSSFIRKRGLSLALVVLILLAITLAQLGISYTLTAAQLSARLGMHLSILAAVGRLVRLGLVALLVTLWVLGRKRALYKALIAVNALATLLLFVDTYFLAKVLAGLPFSDIEDLVVDVALMAASNILIFSIWYRIIDSPGVLEGESEDRPWVFLFPQRESALPGYETWVPHYLDYLFLAFTASFAFSPADTLPLTRTAKMMMMVQTAVSVVTITGIAGSAVSILVGG